MYSGIAGPRGRPGKSGKDGTPGIPGINAWKVQLLNGSFSNDLLIPPSIAGKYLRRYFYYSTLVAVGDSLKFLYKEGTKHTCTLVFIPFTSIIMNNQVTSS